MGSNKRLIVSATGFPGTTETWRFIQDAWREPLKALALLAGNKVIVTGMKQIGGACSDGFIAYEGAIFPFEGGAIGTTVTLIKDVQSSTYDVDLDNDGQQDVLPQYETQYFRFGTGGEVTFPFADLKPLKTILELSTYTLPDGVVVDPNYKAFTQAWIDKLTNVQADWNQTNPANDSFIKNKPAVFKPLRIGSTLLGDFPNATDEKRTINFPTVGTSNYMVLGSFVKVGSAAIWSENNDVIWSIGAKTSTSFELLGREVAPHQQNLRFEYVLIEFESLRLVI
ncbi:MAG TPA: hypothetical protein VLY87_06795 [Flavobacterium sp.]|nr:hypothetical protein [Flavobacterium sp.]